MGMFLTEEVWTLQNFVVFAFILAWFIGWTVAAKHMLQRTELQRRDMVNLAAREIDMQQRRHAKHTKENKKSK